MGAGHCYYRPFHKAVRKGRLHLDSSVKVSVENEAQTPGKIDAGAVHRVVLAARYGFGYPTGEQTETEELKVFGN